MGTEIERYELFRISDCVMTLERTDREHDATNNIINSFVKKNYSKGEVAGVLQSVHSVIDRIDENGIELSIRTCIIKRIRATDEGVFEVRVKAKPPLRFLCFIPDEKSGVVVVMGFEGHKNKRPDEIANANKGLFKIAESLVSEWMRGGSNGYEVFG